MNVDWWRGSCSTFSPILLLRTTNSRRRWAIRCLPFECAFFDFHSLTLELNLLYSTSSVSTSLKPTLSPLQTRRATLPPSIPTPNPPFVPPSSLQLSLTSTRPTLLYLPHSSTRPLSNPTNPTRLPSHPNNPNSRSCLHKPQQLRLRSRRRRSLESWEDAWRRGLLGVWGWGRRRPWCIRSCEERHKEEGRSTTRRIGYWEGLNVIRAWCVGEGYDGGCEDFSGGSAFFLARSLATMLRSLSSTTTPLACFRNLSCCPRLSFSLDEGPRTLRKPHSSPRLPRKARVHLKIETRLSCGLDLPNRKELPQTKRVQQKEEEYIVQLDTL